MYILRIEHQTQDFDGWKKAFDDDPAGRQKSGVRRYKISRAVDNDSFVMIDLEFDTQDQAQAMASKLRDVWSNVEGKIMMNPRTRIVQSIEAMEY